MAKSRLERHEVPVEQTWKVEDLFETTEDWEQALKDIEDSVPTVTQYKGKLHEGSDVLYNCLEAQSQLQEKIIPVATYANLRSSEDGTNPDNQANSGKVASTLAQVGASLSFFDSEVLALPEGTIEIYLEENEDLKVYENLLKELLEYKPYTLSPETEEVLASLSEVHSAPYTIYQRSKSSDMQFDNFKANGEEYSNSFALFEDEYELSTDTDVRRNAYKSFVSTLKQYQNTYAATYATEVKKQVQLAKVRGYDNVTQMLLQPQKVTEEMYHNQLDVIQRELAPHMRRFAKLKKEVLGLDKMTFADLKAPLDPEFNPTTTYEEVSETILEALSVMGPEYTEIMKKGLTERWVDYADNVGKATGAFCASPYGSHPFILLTWTGAMRGGFILAHELGHAGHFYLANKNQRVFNTRPSTYFVEAPSTMNEMLLADHLLEKHSDDDRMRRWIILQLLGTYYHNFVTHLLEGEFQRRVYNLAEQGVPLTANTLKEQKREALANFWGDAVELDEGAELTWMRQPHYYMGLYPYTYSAGLTASTLVSQMIKEEGQPAIDRWLDVLKAGGTKTPQELMKYAGVDMTTPEPIEKAVAHVGSLIDELVNSYETAK
ncbi:oligoendopeptidase F [Piscibacillus halophilus]|uniref:Oligopeptidase F n=1 Tax=Piscibacillus halophilus TaxID=571933 RepID=A0A1H9G844_9BACI|nr:oligoendopeptidase F [Piscibacillus halophilus]SEQ46249.1 oligoendopeptidase F [Piscibacillus halophilus]